VIGALTYDAASYQANIKGLRATDRGLSFDSDSALRAVEQNPIRLLLSHTRNRPIEELVVHDVGHSGTPAGPRPRIHRAS
jgi:hypothetical protein